MKRVISNVAIALLILLMMAGCVSRSMMVKSVEVFPTPLDETPIYIEPTLLAVQEVAPVAVETLPEPVVELYERAVVRMTDAEIHCLSQAMYREAGGEGALGMSAVGYVVLNRMASKGFPNTICGVVHDRRTARGKTYCQFSWSCTQLRHAAMNQTLYNQARAIALQVMRKELDNPIDDSIFFHTRAVRPAYARASNFRNKIGSHQFYAAL